MRSRAICTVVAAGLMVAALSAGTSAQAKPKERAWAPAASATIYPGVKVFIAGGQCTANFVFTDKTDVYVGTSAHCSSTGSTVQSPTCEVGSLPLDTAVEVQGADAPGTLVYSSWGTMRDVLETDRDTCLYNDFALIRLDRGDHDVVNPSVPVWGGPHGIAEPTAVGDQVYSALHSSLSLGSRPMLTKQGVSFGTSGGGWVHPVYTAATGIPGDSGSGYLDAEGNALGVLSTLAAQPWPAANNLTDVGMAIDYMKAHTDELDRLELVHGTEPFGSALPVTLP